MGKNRLDINCSNCGHEFKYGELTPKYCPSCGKLLSEKKYNNIPMDIVPNGMKGYLYSNYKKYNEYYTNSDNWKEITSYLKVIYNQNSIDTIKNELFNVVKGYALRNNKELCFISYDENFIGFCDGNGMDKKNIKICTVDEFKKELLSIAKNTK